MKMGAQSQAASRIRAKDDAREHWRAVGISAAFVCVSFGWLWISGKIESSSLVVGLMGAEFARFLPVLGLAAIGTLTLYAIVATSRKRELKLLSDLRDAEAMLQTAQKMEAFGVLSAGIAHDFSNTLTVIRGMTDLARMESYDPRVSRSAFEAIQLAAFRGEEIARQLVDFLAKPGDQFALRDLNVVTRDFSPILRQAAGAQTIIAYELEESLPPTLLSRTLVEQALLNLVINSRDAVSQTDLPRITIATKTVELIDQRLVLSPNLVSGSFIELSVSDNGCGIPEADLAQAFEPFFTTKEKGTGLGLPSVLRAVQHHEGFVDVRSKMDAGTCIRLLIPIRTGDRAPVVRETAPVPSKVA